MHCFQRFKHIIFIFQPDDPREGSRLIVELGHAVPALEGKSGLKVQGCELRHILIFYIRLCFSYQYIFKLLTLALFVINFLLEEPNPIDYFVCILCSVRLEDMLILSSNKNKCSSPDRIQILLGVMGHLFQRFNI